MLRGVPLGEPITRAAVAPEGEELGRTAVDGKRLVPVDRPAGHEPGLGETGKGMEAKEWRAIGGGSVD